MSVATREPDARQLAMEDMDDRPGHVPQAVRDAYHKSRRRRSRRRLVLADSGSWRCCGALVEAGGKKTCVRCGKSRKVEA